MKVEKRELMAPQWAFEDLLELHSISSKYSNIDLSALQSWQYLSAQRALSMRLASVNPQEILVLWRMILQHPSGGLKFFKSKMAEYITTYNKSIPHSESIKSFIVNLYLGKKIKSMEEEEKKANAVVPPLDTAHSHKMAPQSEHSNNVSKGIKRLESEPPVSEEDKGTVPKPKAPKKVKEKAAKKKEKVAKVKVKSTERCPRLDLKSIIHHATINLTQLCNAQDQSSLKEVATLEKEDERWKKLIANYNIIRTKTPEEFKVAFPNVQITSTKQKPSQKGLDVIKRELKMLQQCYGKTIAEISELYTKVSGDFELIKKHLKGEQVGFWTKEEDDALMQVEDSAEYKNLLTKKGEEEIKKRKRFLKVKK